MLEILSPILQSILKSAVYMFGAITEGFKDMVDNWKSIVFVLCVGIAGGFIGHKSFYNDPACSKTIAQLRKDYSFVPRKKNTVDHPQNEWWKVFK